MEELPLLGAVSMSTMTTILMVEEDVRFADNIRHDIELMHTKSTYEHHDILRSFS
jgi:hypothetical protein